MCRSVWSTFLIVFIWSALGAQVQTDEFVFDKLSLDNGMSNRSVTAIVQDHNGFMWFGTYHGLNRYDGHSIKTYYFNETDSLSLGDDRVTCLFVDDTNNLWVGTNLGGLNLYNRNHDNFIRYTKESVSNYISSNRIESVYQDSNHRLWVATNAGLNLFDYQTQSFKTFSNNVNVKSSINSNQVYTVLEQRANDLLVLTNAGALNRFLPQSQSFESFVPAGIQPKSFATARLLFQDKENYLWIATLQDGLFKLDNNRLVSQYKNEPGNATSLSHNLVKCMLEDQVGRLWIGTDGGGLNIYNRKTDNFTVLRAQQEKNKGLSDNAIHSIYQDKAGSIWVGTLGDGVNIYHPQKPNIKHITRNVNNTRGLSNKIVLSFLEDKDDNFWIGTDGGGLNRYERTTGDFTYYRHNPNNPNSISSDVVKCLYEDSQNNLWVGTYLGGLNLFDRKTKQFKVIKPAGALANGALSIWHIHEDSRQNLWISILGNGVVAYNLKTKTFKHYVPFSGSGALGDYTVMSIHEDNEGTLWFATEDHGVFVFNYQTETFYPYQHNPTDPASLSNNHAWLVLEDVRSNLWIATAGGGLNLFDRKQKKFTSIGVTQGLPSNIITNLLEDNEGNLWLTTSRGITRYNPETKKIKNFDVQDGLQAKDFTVNAAIKLRSGELAFGGTNGFNLFKPSFFRENAQAPDIVFTELKVFNKTILPGGSMLPQALCETEALTLSYEESVITFQFAALNFVSPDGNEYAYKLEGFDHDWIFCGNRHEVTYTNLDAGTYTLKVKTANNDGVWNEEGASLTLIVTPPWWETIWFKLGVLAVIVIGATSAYKIRTSIIRKTLKAEKQHELEVKEVQVREERLRHEKELVELSKKKLEAEVQYKNAELATSVMGAVKQNETLLRLKDDILQASKADNRDEVLRQLKRVVRLIDEEVKPDENWDQFELLFNQIHENFLQKLKDRYPQLTSRDLKLCAYLRMNLNSKEIAPLLSLTVRGVEDLRYRVRKKMELDTSVNLGEFVLSL